MTVHVRPAASGDADAERELWRDSGRFFVSVSPDTAQEPDPDGLREWFDGVSARLAADPAVLRLVAEVDGAFAGAVTARLHEPDLSARWQVQRDLGRRRVHVDALMVAEAHRRSGVGSELMAAVERWAVERGAEVITLETDLRNPAAVPFYEDRMGFVRHEVLFRKPLPPGPPRAAV